MRITLEERSSANRLAHIQACRAVGSIGAIADGRAGAGSGGGVATFVARGSAGELDYGEHEHEDEGDYGDNDQRFHAETITSLTFGSVIERAKSQFTGD
ncbi:hypothetical protein [Nocardia higoensis]|uniref:hypothetical protein n=1 Tax=Nocardia higoensis TaxID=228599 RepID=UPI0012F645AB|nr:hypothetical protein [Nocardia higoensis]